MLTVITDTATLAAAQQTFRENLLAAMPQRITCTVSGVGGGFGGAAARTCLGCAFGRCCDGRAVRGLGAVRGGRLGGTGSVLHAGGSLMVQKE